MFRNATSFLLQMLSYHLFTRDTELSSSPSNVLVVHPPLPPPNYTQRVTNCPLFKLMVHYVQDKIVTTAF